MTPQPPSILDQNSTVPAHLQQYKGDENAAAGLITTFLAIPAISIRGKQFRFMKEGVETPYPIGQPLKAVILGFDPPKGLAKSFYKGAYKPGEDESPDCFSSDGLTPDPLVTEPVSRSCTECPHNAWGSGINSAGETTDGKRCGDHKNIFLVAADELDGDIAVMRIPPTSLKALSAHAALIAKHGVPIQSMVVELSFTDDEHPQLVFKCLNWLSADECERMVARGASNELSGMKPTNNRGTAVAKAETLALPEGPKPEATDPPPPPSAPEVPKAAPVMGMTAKANGVSYESYIGKGWTDAQLIEHGLLAEQE